MARSRLHKLMTERPVLLVSLPRNDDTLAAPALSGGADGLKVHLNVEHRASGTHFGSWSEEREALAPVLARGALVGMVPGAGGQMISPQELGELEGAGIDFLDTYIQDMPTWLPERARRAGVMAALSWRDREGGWSLGHLEGRAELIEASVVRPEGYGQPLQEEDLAQYREICARYPQLPVVVPTQRALRPAEVGQVLEAGARGILIGAVVTGREPESIAQVTRQFALALAAAL